MSQRITSTTLAQIATISPDPRQTRVAHSSESSPRTWGQFRNRGIVTATGRLSASEASIQVLMLPGLMLLWAVVVAVIAAAV